jgi:hypothetical protein
MEADAGSPTPQRAATKRTALSVIVIIAGMILFAAFQSLHSTQEPDYGNPVAATARPTATFHDAAPDAAPASNPAASAPIRYGSLTFHGYPCTLDCSGHMAGFNFGKATGVRRPGDCPNAPQYFHSLTEGCWAEAGRQGSS